MPSFRRWAAPRPIWSDRIRMYSAEQSGRGQSPTHGPERGCQPATFAKKMSAAKMDANLAREEWPACGTGEIGGGFWGWTMVDRPGQGCWADKTNRNSLDGGERATGPLSPYPVAWTAITRIARPDTRRRILAPVRRRSTGFFLNGIEIGTPPYGLLGDGWRSVETPAICLQGRAL